MNTRHLALVTVAFCALIGLTEPRAEAQIFDDGYLQGWYPYWFGGPAYQSSRVPTPPYFAIHPPVYYGTRVGMPYGNSPITRPPRAILRDSIPSREPITAPVGQMIENPFYEKPSEVQPSTPREERKRRATPAARAPKTTENPHFVSGEGP